MIPSSLVATLATLVFGVLALVVFGWAWRRGHFRDVEVQARVIFEPRDCRIARPWETPSQRLEREITYGPLVRPQRGNGEATHDRSHALAR